MAERLLKIETEEIWYNRKDIKMLQKQHKEDRIIWSW